MRTLFLYHGEWTPACYVKIINTGVQLTSTEVQSVETNDCFIIDCLDAQVVKSGIDTYSPTLTTYGKPLQLSKDNWKVGLGKAIVGPCHAIIRRMNHCTCFCNRYSVFKEVWPLVFKQNSRTNGICSATKVRRVEIVAIDNCISHSQTKFVYITI